jgi:carboxymethylenebutenolidase
VLTALGVPHDVKEYPDAGHSLLNEHKDATFKLLKILHISYHEPSARDARRRIISFFNTQLRRRGA